MILICMNPFALSLLLSLIFTFFFNELNDDVENDNDEYVHNEYVDDDGHYEEKNLMSVFDHFASISVG